VRIEPPTVSVRDQREESAQRQRLFAQGLLSQQTWSEQEGLDWELEQSRRRNEGPHETP
jgi:hypothetical protein